jgi:hypothetical protein
MEVSQLGQIGVNPRVHRCHQDSDQVSVSYTPNAQGLIAARLETEGNEMLLCTTRRIAA